MKNEYILPEMMSHVPILAHGMVERVLIAGAAARGLAREVLRHPGVDTVVQVQVGDGGADAAPIRDERFHFQPRDSAEYLAVTTERFDLVLAPMLSATELRLARGCLRAGGVVVTPLGAPFVQPRRFFENMKSLSSVFSRAAAYLVPVPGAFGGPLALGWGSNVGSPDIAMPATLAARLSGSRVETRYYTPSIHLASFALPRFVQELVSAATCAREESGAETLHRVLRHA